MSSLALPDEVPFVFGAYASHLNEVAPPVFTVEADVIEPPSLAEPEADRPGLPLTGTFVKRH